VFTLFIMSPVYVTPFALLFVGGYVSKADALTIYGVQIQVFAVFLALAPIFFALFSSQKRTAQELRNASLLAVVEICGALLGIVATVVLMIRASVTGGFFGVSLVLEPFPFVALVAMAPIIYILAAGGVLNPVLGWIFRDQPEAVPARRRPDPMAGTP
jgi:hypothetical protein